MSRMVARLAGAAIYMHVRSVGGSLEVTEVSEVAEVTEDYTWFLAERGPLTSS